ncbi:MAG: MarR family transcriptional regulator [Erythrobacter sp.]
MATTADRFHDRVAAGMGRARLAEIAAKLAEVAAQLNEAAAQDADEGSGIGPLTGDCPQQRSALATARHAYWLRRQRAQIFGSADLFGEPAWDILLDLYIAHAEGKQVSVSSACIGSASPATTGLRWLSVLTEQGLIAREADEHDHRRIMVRLTQRGIAAMERFLALAQGR